MIYTHIVLVGCSGEEFVSAGVEVAPERSLTHAADLASVARRGVTVRLRLYDSGVEYVWEADATGKATIATLERTRRFTASVLGR